MMLSSDTGDEGKIMLMKCRQPHTATVTHHSCPGDFAGWGNICTSLNKYSS